MMATKKELRTESQKKDLKGLINHIRQLYIDWMDAVNSVIVDQNSILNKYDIYMAVDFRHIYEYAYPFDSLIQDDGPVFSNATNYQEQLVQRWAGLSFLFNNVQAIKKPVLLAPHIPELKSHFENYHSHKYLENEMALYKSEYDFLTKEEKELLKIVSDAFSNKQELSQGVQSKIEELIFTKFYALFVLISGFSNQGINRIKELLKNNKIIIDSDIVQDFSEIIHETIDNPYAKFYNIFSLIRNKPTPDYNDAKLLELVVVLNCHFIENKIFKKVYLLSDTHSFKSIFHPKEYINGLESSLKMKKKLLNDSLDKVSLNKLRSEIASIERNIEKIKNEFGKISTDITIWGAGDTIYRSPNIFVAYMIDNEKHLKKEDSEFVKTRIETIRNLEQRKSKLLQFNFFDTALDELSENCINNCDMCPSNIKYECEKFQENITKWKQAYNKRVSIDLIDSYSEMQVRLTNETTSSIQMGIKAIVEYLSNPSKSFHELVLKKRKELDESYIDTVNELKTHLKESAFLLHEELIFRLKPLRRIPFTLRFDVKEIEEVLNEAQGFIVNFNSLSSIEKESDIIINKIRNLSNKIIDLAFNKELGAEASLLFATLNFNFNKFENANIILTDCLKSTNLKNRQQYLLIKILALSQHACNIKNDVYYKEAKDLCQSELKRYYNDSRFYYLFGVVVGRGIQTNLEYEYEIQVSINYFEQALRYLDEGNSSALYEATIWNSIAFAICLKDTDQLLNEDIEYSIGAIQKMSNLIDKSDWDANFIDTTGLVSFLRAKNCENEKEAMKFHIEAKKFFERAYDLARDNKYLYYERKEIERHLKMVNVIIESYLAKSESESSDNAKLD